jgi:hypothetical protein
LDLFKIIKKEILIERGILQQFILGLCDKEDESLVRSQLSSNSELKDVTHDMEIMLNEMISMHMNMPCVKSKKSCLEQAR